MAKKFTLEDLKALGVSEEVLQKAQAKAAPAPTKRVWVIKVSDELLAQMKATFPEVTFTARYKSKAKPAPAAAPSAPAKPDGKKK